MSSSLLHRVIVAHRCRSTHHHIAITALTRLKGEHAEGWRDLLLANHMDLLEGAKAPDKKFKDFKNHVLHVGEGEWGGARNKAMEWYAEAVEALKKKKWSKAAYALGVMSHYYADPIQPFHTGQTEEEGAVHRALEWSIAQSRDLIEARIETTGYPKVEAGEGVGFVSDMVRAGADKSHPHYQTLIDHYNLEAGVKDPRAGMDETLIHVIADLVAYATAGLATIYERAFEEAAVAPPKVTLSLLGYLATLDIPLRWLTKKLSDAEDRTTVQLIYDEWKSTGKVVSTLPDDDHAIRRLHARQVLRVPVKDLDAKPAGPIGSKHVPMDPPAEPENLVDQDKARPAPSKIDTIKDEAAAAAQPAKKAPKPTEPVKPEEIAAASPEASAQENEDAAAAEPAPSAWTEDDGLTLDAPVHMAPSIGRKTATRLGKIGVLTVGDLLGGDVAEMSAQLKVKFMSARTLSDWQDQTRLMLSMPSLRVHDAQILVGAGVRTVDDLADASARDLLDAAMDFLSSSEGARTVRGDYEPNAAEVDDWIDQARAVGE